MRKARPIAITLLVCAVAGLGWIGIRQLQTAGEAPDAIQRAEQALSTQGMIALARLDVPELRDVLQKAETEPAGAALDFDRELLEPLGLRGVSIAGDVSTALVSVSSAEHGARVSAVLFGAFDPAALEAAIRTADPSVRPVSEAGERTLYLSRLDPESCAETVWGVALRSDRIVIQNERSLEPLLAALGPPDPPRSGWRAKLEQRPLATLRFAPLEEAPTARTQPLARAVLHGARRALSDVERVALRVERTALRGGLQLQMEVHARDSEAAAALAARWKKAEGPGEDWMQIAPALAGWFSALRVERDGPIVRARAERGADALRELRDLPATLVVAASRDFDEPTSARAATDQVEPWPTVFLERFPLGKLPSYGSGRATADAADARAGPFGLRIERASRAGSGDPIELTLRAHGPLIPNLPEPQAAARLFVERVLDADGKELRREERCGPDRNALPALLGRASIVERSEAEKRIRLRSDARLGDVERIEGHIEFDLPERTQSVRTEKPRIGQTLEVAGASVEITSATERSFSYRVRGEPRLIHIRGLNAGRVPLASIEAWEADLPFGEGRLGGRRYAGSLASLEAIFALDVRHASYAFALTSARPSSDGSSLDVESSEFIHYTADQYQKEFGSFKGHAWPADRSPLGVAKAGPFTVALTSLAPGARLVLQLGVLAPAVPNLTYNATALELSLSEIGLQEGRPLRPERAGLLRDWRALLQLRHRYGREYLEGSAPLDTGAPTQGSLHHVSGELLLRLPHEVESVNLPEVEPGASLADADVAFTLTELWRDGFALRMSGPLDRFFSARAFGENGKELSVEALAIPLSGEDTSRELRFRVQGQPRRIAIQLTHGYTSQRYTFRIPIGDPAAPAAAAP